MSKPTIYVFMNKSLGMSAGKLAAQAAHAVALVPVGNEWTDAAHRTMLIMQARDASHMMRIKDYLAERGVGSYMVIDEGVNEIDPHSVTALATDIVDKEIDHINQTFSTFELYRDDIKVTLEFTR